jgi:predicted AAA+ superfamily ATPase
MLSGSSPPRYRRPFAEILAGRLSEPRRFIQVVAGARQVGKTTLVDQVLGDLPGEAVYVSADQPTLRDAAWLAAQWERARSIARDAGEAGPVLAIDEIQKVPDWSETVKRLWDEDGRAGIRLKVVLLGSSPLLVQRGLSESLAGRFEILHLPHWSLAEMREAFGFSLDDYLVFGGYPGAAPLIRDPERWRRYLLDSLIETSISRDVLLMTRVDKPALLRQLFELGCRYSGQVLSYTKMLGQLQDAGNTTTLAHYITLLEGAGMLTGLTKFAGQAVRRRGSSPKLQVFDTALMTALADVPPDQVLSDPSWRGLVVESAIGSHLVNAAARRLIDLYYWRDGDREVDFVVRAGRDLVAIEVKSGSRVGRRSGLAAFSDAFGAARPLLVGGDGIPVDEFLMTPVGRWVGHRGEGSTSRGEDR